MTISNGQPYVEVQLDIHHIATLQSGLLLHMQELTQHEDPNVPLMMENLIAAWQIYQVLDAAWDTLAPKALQAATRSHP